LNTWLSLEAAVAAVVLPVKKAVVVVVPEVLELVRVFL
jgi:hypothetical protein